MATEFESQSTNHERWMREALSLAQQAAEADEVPVGAIVVHNGEIIGRGFNQLGGNDSRPCRQARFWCNRTACRSGCESGLLARGRPF